MKSQAPSLCSLVCHEQDAQQNPDKIQAAVLL